MKNNQGYINRKLSENFLSENRFIIAIKMKWAFDINGIRTFIPMDINYMWGLHGNIT